MGFLKRFLHNVFREEASPAIGSSFEHLSEEELESHLEIRQYGDFRLSDAVRPSFDLQIVPQQGFRHDVYLDDDAHREVPVLMASLSQERIFEVFMEMLDPLGDVVDVVLETSHQKHGTGHEDLYRERMDLPVLKSMLWDYEELLTHDGFTGLAVLNPHTPQEVQLDEHKLLIVYADQLEAFENVLKRNSVRCNEKIKFITEAEHVHSSHEDFLKQFEELKMRLGMDESDDWDWPMPEEDADFYDGYEGAF
ncbi:Hypothetical protein PBC10988_14940 [Planctomycetales bacterium 10988]|nr:Hypothetical protein PBC10988_14940 [Planctomycetales bacterium 10988]